MACVDTQLTDSIRFAVLLYSASTALAPPAPTPLSSIRESGDPNPYVRGGPQSDAVYSATARFSLTRLSPSKTVA